MCVVCACVCVCVCVCVCGGWKALTVSTYQCKLVHYSIQLMNLFVTNGSESILVTYTTLHNDDVITNLCYVTENIATYL